MMRRELLCRRGSCELYGTHLDDGGGCSRCKGLIMVLLMVGSACGLSRMKTAVINGEESQLIMTSPILNCHVNGVKTSVAR